jgi:hypothetical protein
MVASKPKPLCKLLSLFNSRASLGSASRRKLRDALVLSGRTGDCAMLRRSDKINFINEINCHTKRERVGMRPESTRVYGDS